MRCVALVWVIGWHCWSSYHHSKFVQPLIYVYKPDIFVMAKWLSSISPYGAVGLSMAPKRNCRVSVLAANNWYFDIKCQPPLNICERKKKKLCVVSIWLFFAHTFLRLFFFPFFFFVEMTMTKFALDIFKYCHNIYTHTIYLFIYRFPPILRFWFYRSDLKISFN